MSLDYRIIYTPTAFPPSNISTGLFVKCEVEVDCIACKLAGWSPFLQDVREMDLSLCKKKRELNLFLTVSPTEVC